MTMSERGRDKDDSMLKRDNDDSVLKRSKR